MEELFEKALDMRADIREAWLAEACSDPDLRYEVSRLISASSRAATFLEEPAEISAADLIAEATQPTLDRAGPYRIIEEIGRGGMGIVYLAERADGQYEQRVAIKLLRHAVGSKELYDRFLAERQILASLSHANIAGLLDGGVTEHGQPYLVMSWVDGSPIDAYCDERELDIEKRLRLFLTVCETVQYAHQQLVVHRDIKPSNILIRETGSGSPQVKLLDFGIAKLLNPDAPGEPAAGAPVTRTGLHLMTPEYASPEQVTGAHITTASDVYQLGLLLYRLLTGVPAYTLASHSVTEIARVVCEQEPLLPSRVRSKGIRRGRAQKIHRDLDAMVMKALRKEPERRYGTARMLADDVLRYLEGRPVTARSGTTSYLLQKFVRRNAPAVVSGIVIVLLIITYAVSITLQQARTAQQRDRAEQYASFLTDLFDGTSPFTTLELGPETTLGEFLDDGTERVRAELSDEPALQASLLSTIGGAYGGLGDHRRARELYREAMTRQLQLYGEVSPEYVETLRLLAWSTEDPLLADSLHRRGIAHARELEAGAGPRTAHGLSTYGHFLQGQGHLEDAVRLHEEAAGMLDDADEGTRVTVLYFLALALGDMNRLSAADSLLRVVYDIRRKTHGPRHPQTAVIMTYMGNVAESRGDLDTATHWKGEALAIFEERLGSEHPYTIIQLNNMAVLVGFQGRHEESERMHRRVLEWRERHLGPTHRDAITSLQNIAATLLRQGRLDEAEPLFWEVSDRFTDSLPSGHYLHAYPFLSLADLYLQRASFQDAEDAASEAMKRLEGALPHDHPLTSVAWSRLGEALMRQDRLVEAEALLIQASEVQNAAEGYDAYRLRTNERLAILYETLERPDDVLRVRSLGRKRPPSEVAVDEKIAE